MSSAELRKALISSTDIEEKKAELEKKYGVKFNFEPSAFRPYSFKHKEVLEIKKSLAILEKEFKKYPPGFLKSRNVKINLISDLKKNGIKYGGFYTNGNIYLDEALTFDHEFYHLLDDNSGNDRNWDKQDGNLGFGWYEGLPPDKKSSSVDKLPSGFARQYGQVNTNEDQATIAESLLSDSVECPARILLSREVGDVVLSKKVEQIKSEYYKWSSGLMDKAFFERIAIGYTIDEDYWDARVHTTRENPKKVSLNPDKLIYIAFAKDVIWLDLGRPFSICYVESTPEGKINWDKRLNFSGEPTEDPLFTCNDGLFMWGLNYDKRKNGAVLICDPLDKNKVIGKIAFVNSEN